MYRIIYFDNVSHDDISIVVSSLNFLDELFVDELLARNPWLTISLTFVNEDSE